MKTESKLYRMKSLFAKYYVPILLIVLFLLFFILSLMSDGTYGGSDDYMHYKFARYAFKYPYLYLEHWAKPVFTFLASPFAQFGFMGIKIFNLIVGLFTSYLTYRVCKLFNFRFSWLAIIIVCFAPVYLSLLLSGMTEILFSFVLILSIFLAIRGDFLWSAIILSMLPFVRNEGVAIFPLFIAYYAIRCQYKAIPLMLTGFIIISLAGVIYYKDLFWVITKMPYTGAKDIYGSGSLMHFVNASKVIFGVPLAILGVLGFIYIGFELIKSKCNWVSIKSSHQIEMVLLIVGSFLAYYVAHSILWWKGWGGSLGLIRVIAGVIPLFTVIGMKGISGVMLLLPSKKWVAYPLIAAIVYFIMVTPFKVLQVPVELGSAEKTIKDAAMWLHEKGLDTNRVYYYDPYYWFGMDINPYDQEKVWEVVPNRQIPSQDIPDKSVIFWDSHYGPNEGKLPLEKLMNDTFLILQKVFRPLQPFITLGGYNYEICIFQKTFNTNDIARKWKFYQKTDSLNEISMTTFHAYNFETDNQSFKSFVRSDSVVFTGKFSCLVEKNEEFGPTILLSFKELKYPNVYRASVMIHSLGSINWKAILLVASAEHNEKLYFYSTQNPTIEKGRGWMQAKLSFELPKPKSSEDILKVYIWNKDRQRFFIDDFEISK